MEVLLLGIFFWLILKLVGKRQQLTKAKRAYLTMVDDAAMGLADEQFAYEAGVESLPDLEGDGTFSFEVSLTRADNDDLESIYTYLDLKGLKRESLATVLKSERVGSASQVAVEPSALRNRWRGIRTSFVEPSGKRGRTGALLGQAQ
jgi:hypothetical protein